MLFQQLFPKTEDLPTVLPGFSPWEEAKNVEWWLSLGSWWVYLGMRAVISQGTGLGRRDPGSNEVFCADSLSKSSTSGGIKMSQLKKVALPLAHGLFQAVWPVVSSVSLLTYISVLFWVHCAKEIWLLYGTLLCLSGYVKVVSAQFVPQCRQKHWQWPCKMGESGATETCPLSTAQPTSASSGAELRCQGLTTASLTLSPSEQVRGMKGAWRPSTAERRHRVLLAGPHGAARHEPGAAVRQDAPWGPQRLRFPARPGAAQPDCGGEWLSRDAGRPRSRPGLALLAAVFLSKPSLLTQRLLASLV